VERRTTENTDERIDEPLRHGSVSPQQVAPWPEVELETNLDRRRLVRDLIDQHPGATADDIARMLAEKRIEISSTLVLQVLQRK